MTPEQLQKLYAYTYWAFDRVWNCIDALTDEQFTQELDYSIGSIRHHIVHLMSAERRWMLRMQEIQPDDAERLQFEDYMTKQAARAKYDEVRVGNLAYIHSLTQAKLDEVVKVYFPFRELRMTWPRHEFLAHVANHATDHRAQILAMLHTHFGVETVEQDMFFYLEELSGV